MQFIQIGKIWYQFNIKNNRLYNYKNGWIPYDDFEDTILQIIEAKDWLDLFDKTGYCPLVIDSPGRDAWIDPRGNCYQGCAHDLAAENICEFFGFENIDHPSDFLIKNGWIKTTISAMGHFYAEEGMYLHLTKPQYETLEKWANKYNIRMDEKYFRMR